MSSNRPKVLHEVANRSMLGHVLAAVKRRGRDAHRRRRRARTARTWRRKPARHAADAEIFVQRERLGTGHAVLSAREALERRTTTSSSSMRDTPLVSPETLAKLREPLRRGAAVVSLGFEARDPTGYGRLHHGRRRACSPSASTRMRPKKNGRITLCNGGLMALRGDVALAILDRIGRGQRQGRILPDRRGRDRPRGWTSRRRRGRVRRRRCTASTIGRSSPTRSG